MKYSHFNKHSYNSSYGKRMQRLVIDGGFSCPNRDGSLSFGGCTFCDNAAFHPSYTAGKSISEQIDRGIEFHASRNNSSTSYLAYFQAFSNTYADLATLRKRYKEALAHPAISGIVIGTRPDCVDASKLDYIASLKQSCEIVEIEYGIESVYDSTLQRINRGHDFACSCRAIEETAARGIDCGAHIIIGLPGESREMQLGMAEKLSELPISSVKFHQLQILKGTKMEKEHLEHPEQFLRMSAEEYIALLADIVERLRADIAIARIASSVPPRFTNSPWGLLKHEQLFQMLEAELCKRNSCQACFY